MSIITNVTVVETGVLVETGTLRYATIEYAAFDRYSEEPNVTLPEPFMASIAGMEFDSTGCSMGCKGFIGFHLLTDRETGYDSPAFNEFTLVQVGEGPVTRLCADCAEVIHTAIGES